LLKSGAAFGLAFDFLQNGGIGKSVHDRGLSAPRIIIRNLDPRRCVPSLPILADSLADQQDVHSIRTAEREEELHFGRSQTGTAAWLRKGRKAQKAQNFHKT
jgi:hypothetical protein